ncbi:MAG: MFS transporter [Pseudomonadota bacterium]|nr:MFS transporter [Pseudomonadota bacterium]
MKDAQPVVLTQWLDGNRFSPYQAFVVLLGFLVTTFDGFDTQAIAFSGPAIQADFGIGPAGLTPVVTAGVVGMALGALLFGPLGDRYGRRFAVLLSTACFGCFALATAYALPIAQLLVGAQGEEAADTAIALLILFRFLTGIGMGGATPNVLALASEFSPERRRGICMLLATLGLPVGAIIGSAMAPRLIPLHGWESIFIIGGAAPLLFLLLLWWVLPESPQLLAARGDHEGARRLLDKTGGTPALPGGTRFTLPERQPRVGIGALFAPELRSSTIAIWLVYFFNWVAWFSLILWLPMALNAAGMSVVDAARGTMVLNGAALVFILPLAWYLPRLPVKQVVAALLLLGVVTSVAMAAAGSQWTLMMVLVALSGLFIGGPQIALNYLAVAIYPTQLRATGVGAAIGIGRVGTILGAAVGGLILERGVAIFYLSFCAPLAIAAVGALLIRPVSSARARPGDAVQTNL